MDDVIPVLSLVIAGLAVFFGPFVQLRIARRQIVSPIRQRWIDDLRAHVAELIWRAQVHEIYPEDPAGTHKQLLLTRRKIELLLDPQESDHAALLKAIERLIRIVLDPQKKDPLGDFTDALQQTTSLAQAVFKREWQRVS